MAARSLHPRHQDEVRQKIQSSQLINRLDKHARGKLELSQTQVRSIEILLRKTLPDLNATTLAGDANNPLRWEGIQRNVVDPHDVPVKPNGHATHTNGAGVQTAPDSEPV